MNLQELGAAIGCAKAAGWKFEPLRLTNTGTDEATVAFDDTLGTGTVLKIRRAADAAFEDWDLSAISLQPGEFVEIAGDNHEAGGCLGKFELTGEAVAASGSIMSIVYGENMTEDQEKVIPFAHIFYNDDSDEGLFYECESLTSAPKLPATTLKAECYNYMFYGCTGLTAAPELPATTLEAGCYSYMFYGCTSLTAAPELPATELADGCYADMFHGCIGLTAAPELPATTLEAGCYNGMFYGCTGLTAAPELPATELVDGCYADMFHGCAGLTAAPELPATELAERCYDGMFSVCTGLTAAPELPATTLESSCYRHMFSGCAGLTAVNVAFTDWGSNNETDTWLNNVAAEGTFTCPAGLDTTTRDASHVPAGWTVQTV